LQFSGKKVSDALRRVVPTALQELGNPQPSFPAGEEGSETKWFWVRAPSGSERLRYSPNRK